MKDTKPSPTRLVVLFDVDNTLLDVSKLQLFVHIDQHISIHCSKQARAIDFPRLEDHIAVA